MQDFGRWEVARGCSAEEEGCNARCTALCTGEHAEPCACALALGRVCDGVSAVRKACREEIRNGATHLKIMVSGGVSSPCDRIDSTQFAEDELTAAVEVCRMALRGLRTANCEGVSGTRADLCDAPFCVLATDVRRFPRLVQRPLGPVCHPPHPTPRPTTHTLAGREGCAGVPPPPS